MRQDSLLIELFVEELPPKALARLGAAFGEGVLASLRASSLVDEAAQLKVFATPRRLAVHISKVRDRSPDQAVSHKLMPVSVGLAPDGQPTPALLKKLASLGEDASAVARLQTRGDGKAQTLFLDAMAQGVSLAVGAQKALDAALAQLPIPKVMTYQLEDGCSVILKITLLDGTPCYETDSSYYDEIPIDHNDKESGLNEGLKMLRTGEKAKMILPNHLAHGLIGDLGKIPPLAIILVDVELVELR